MKPKPVAVIIRLPAPLHVWLKKHAAKNQRSVNAQVIHMLEREKEKKR